MTKPWIFLFLTLLSPIGFSSQSPPVHRHGGEIEKRQDVKVVGDHYFGFSSIKYLFYFGDSYTTVRYDINSSPKPNPQTPLGVNYPGLGSSNGPSWPAEMTYHLNYSEAITFNMAFGGATVDRFIVSPFLDLIECFREQVRKWRFRLGSKPNTIDWPYPWNSNDSLFFFWFGINDLWRSNGWTNGSTSLLHDRIINSYFAGIQELYDVGARNFVVINVPPLELTPELRSRSIAEQDTVRTSVYQFNSKLRERVEQYKIRWKPATFFHIDIHQLFHDLDANASYYGFRNKYTRCPHYTPFQYSDLGYNQKTGQHMYESKYDARCLFVVRSFMWLDAWHPTARVQEAIAGKVVSTLVEYP